MPVTNVLILGAGPCGLSTAIALSKISTAEAPLQITVLELRPNVQTLGGTINLTPLALRYLDYLGAGAHIRSRGCKVNQVDVASLRTGRFLGSLWNGLDLVRAGRKDVVESLLETILAEQSVNVRVFYGKRTLSITEVTNSDGNGKVILELEGGERLEVDVLFGCDGLHSAVRRLYVEPSRKKVYTGRVVAMGYVNSLDDDEGETPEITQVSGESGLTGTTMIHGAQGALMVSYFEPTKSQIYLGAVMSFDEPTENARDGWKAIDDDKESLRSDILHRWQHGKLRGIQELISRCYEWSFYPVYALAPKGRWTRGRVLLLGDAAHAMSPQGESMGLAIEDGVLLAHVFQRRNTRSVEQMFSDYEVVRRSVVDKHYREADWRWRGGNTKSSWIWSIVLEWFTVILLAFVRMIKINQFKQDVRELKLPD